MKDHTSSSVGACHRTTGANAGGWPLPNGTYWLDGSTGTGKFARFTPTISTNGYYDVYIWWVYASNRANNTPVLVRSASATNTVVINQQINCTNWVKIASSNYFNIGTSGSVTITNGGANGYVVANAVRFMPLGSIAPNPPTPTPVVQIIASDAVAGEFGTNTARITLVCPNGTNTAPLVVNYSVSGTATPGVDYAALPGTITIPAGVLATNILILPLGNNLATNQATVTLTLAGSTNYVFTNLASATAVILDRPINNWLRANFSAAELTNALISGDAADPDHDGLPNLIEYAVGLAPNTANANPFSPWVTNGIFTITYPQSKTALDVVITPEWSTNLATWISGPAIFQTVAITDQVTNQLITLRANFPAPTGFIRWRVARQ